MEKKSNSKRSYMALKRKRLSNFGFLVLFVLISCYLPTIKGFAHQSRIGVDEPEDQPQIIIDSDPFVRDVVDFIDKAVHYVIDRVPNDVIDSKNLTWGILKLFVESKVNPYPKLKGSKSFNILFHYIHTLNTKVFPRESELFGLYRCFHKVFPRCLDEHKNVVSKIVYRFQCAYQFYRSCNYEEYAARKELRVPDVNKWVA